jgi:hypothetical protein
MAMATNDIIVDRDFIGRDDNAGSVGSDDDNKDEDDGVDYRNVSGGQNSMRLGEGEEGVD